MKRRIVVLLATVATALALAGAAHAVTLVNPVTIPGGTTIVSMDGIPVGGQWQQWVNEMKVPTIPGPLPFSVDTFVCGGPPACSQGVPGGGEVPVSYVDGSNPNAQHNLYFELGHQFDWAILTNANRLYLAKKWGHPHHAWADSLAGLTRGEEDGLEGLFADIYADCARGQNDNNASIGIGSPSDPNTAQPTINTCRYIDQLARRVGADMESTALAPWNRFSLRWRLHSR